MSLQKRIDGKLELLNFKIPGKKPVDRDVEYSAGFKKACEDADVDPQDLLAAVDALELQL